MKIDLEQLFGYLNTFAAVLLPLFSLFGVIAGLILFWQAGKSLVWGHKGGGGSHEEGPQLGSIGLKMLIGAILMQFANSVEMTSTGLLAGTGSGTRETLALVVTTTSPTWELILKTSFLWLAVIGVAGIFKGFLLWAKAANGDSQGGGGDPFWAGLWHILGGAIMVNIGT